MESDGIEKLGSSFFSIASPVSRTEQGGNAWLPLLGPLYSLGPVSVGLCPNLGVNS